MARTNKVVSESRHQKSQPALTPEAEEKKMIALAMSCAEEQMRNGTASSQVITHFLKLGTERERLEREKLEQENRLLIAKTHAFESDEEIKRLYTDAIEAFRTYSGMSYDDEED